MAEIIEKNVVIKYTLEGGSRFKNEVDNSNKAVKGFKEVIEESQEELRKAANDSQAFARSQGQVANQTQQARAAVRTSIRDFRIFGTSINDITEGLGRKRTALRNVVQSLGGATSGMRALRLAIVATGIGAFILALTSLVAFFRRTTEGADLVSKAFGAVGATIDVVLTRVTDFGSALVDVFRGSEGAGERLRATFSGIGDEIQEAINLSNQLVDTQREIVNSRRAATFNEALLNRLIREQNQIAEDTNNTTSQRIAAAERTLDLNTQLLNSRREINEEEANAIRLRLQLAGSEIEQEQIRQEFAENRARDQDIQTQFFELQTTQTNRLNTIRAEAERARLARLEEIRKLEETIANNNLRFAQQNEDLQNQLLSGLTRSSAELRTAARRDIESIRELLEQGLVDEDLANQQIELIGNILSQGLQQVTTEFLSDLEQLEPVIPQVTIQTPETPNDLFPDIEIQAEETVNRTIGIFERLGRGLEDVFGDSEGLEALREVLGETLDLFGEAAQQRIDFNDQLIDSSRERLDQLLQAENFDQQAVNNERERIDELQSNREEALRRQRRIAAAQIALSSAQSVATAINALVEAFSTSGNVLQGIAAAASIFATISSTQQRIRGLFDDLPAFKDGKPYVNGPGTTTSDSIVARLSVGERITDAMNNARLMRAGIVDNKKMVDYALLGQKVANSQVRQEKIKGNAQSDLNDLRGEMSAMRKESKRMADFIENMKTQVNLDKNGVVSIVTTKRSITKRKVKNRTR